MMCIFQDRTLEMYAECRYKLYSGRVVVVVERSKKLMSKNKFICAVSLLHICGSIVYLICKSVGFTVCDHGFVDSLDSTV